MREWKKICRSGLIPIIFPMRQSRKGVVFSSNAFEAFGTKSLENNVRKSKSKWNLKPRLLRALQLRVQWTLENNNIIPSMSRSLIPAAANLIVQHGSHVLLMKRSHKTKVWPNFWAFPWGKVDENELWREAALREAREEIGIHVSPSAITAEAIVMFRTIQWTKVGYFARVEQYENSPEILETHLATDLAWFPITELPEPMVPQHKVGLKAILDHIGYVEMDMI